MVRVMSLFFFITFLSCNKKGDKNEIVLVNYQDTISCMIGDSVFWDVDMSFMDSSSTYYWDVRYPDSLEVTSKTTMRHVVTFKIVFDTGQPKIPEGEEYVIFIVTEKKASGEEVYYSKRLPVYLEDCD